MPLAAGSSDDEDLIIEQLLDSLEARHEPSQSSNQHDPSSGSKSDVKTLTEEAFELLGLLGPEMGSDNNGNGADGEAFNALLKEFCADGDERVVDELLDNFLGSDCEVGKLIESLSKGMPSATEDLQPAPAAKPEQKKKMCLDLGGVRGLNYLDTLLGSARGILQDAQSARGASKEKPKRRPHSAHPASEKKKKPRPKSAHPTGMVSSPHKASSPRKDNASSPRKVDTPHDAKIEGEAVASPSKGNPVAEDAVVSAASSDAAADKAADNAAALSNGYCGRDRNQSECPHSPVSNANQPEVSPGIQLLAKIAAMDDAEALRGFVKRFLIGVRSRVDREVKASGAQAGNDSAEYVRAADDESSESGSWEEVYTVVDSESEACG